jgi:hypothetical protein
MFGRRERNQGSPRLFVGIRLRPRHAWGGSASAGLDWFPGPSRPESAGAALSPDARGVGGLDDGVLHGLGDVAAPGFDPGETCWRCRFGRLARVGEAAESGPTCRGTGSRSAPWRWDVSRPRPSRPPPACAGARADRRASGASRWRPGVWQQWDVLGWTAKRRQSLALTSPANAGDTHPAMSVAGGPIALPLGLECRGGSSATSIPRVVTI